MLKFLFGPRKSPTKIFWEWFAANANKFSDVAKINRADIIKLGRLLKNAHKELTYEIGFPNGTPELYISADGNRNFFGAVREFVKSAPVIPGWKIVAFRQPTPNPENFDIQLNGRTIKGSDLWIVPIPEEFMFHLKVYSPGYHESDKAQMQALFIILDTTLGEEIMETRIGNIKFLALVNEEKPHPDAIRLNALQQIVLRLN